MLIARSRSTPRTPTRSGARHDARVLVPSGCSGGAGQAGRTAEGNRRSPGNRRRSTGPRLVRGPPVGRLRLRPRVAAQRGHDCGADVARRRRVPANGHLTRGRGSRMLLTTTEAPKQADDACADLERRYPGNVRAVRCRLYLQSIPDLPVYDVARAWRLADLQAAYPPRDSVIGRRVGQIFAAAVLARASRMPAAAAGLAGQRAPGTRACRGRRDHRSHRRAKDVLGLRIGHPRRP